jgi:hypothetical protein
MAHNFRLFRLLFITGHSAMMFILTDDCPEHFIRIDACATAAAEQ